MTKEELDIQKEIENYFTESTGFGRDKIKNFIDIVNKALKQKVEQITELENKIADVKANCDLAIEGRDIKIKELEQQIEKMKCCENCIHHSFWGNELVCNLMSYDDEFECLKTKSKWELDIK